ncbi:hypothetical protein ACLOJK_024330 [Asimina triloba]
MSKYTTGAPISVLYLPQITAGETHLRRPLIDRSGPFITKPAGRSLKIGAAPVPCRTAETQAKETQSRGEIHHHQQQTIGAPLASRRPPSAEQWATNVQPSPICERQRSNPPSTMGFQI